MSEARSGLEWAQTAEVLCVLYNANRDHKKRPYPFTAAEFNPLAPASRRTKRPAADMADIRAAVECGVRGTGVRP